MSDKKVERMTIRLTKNQKANWDPDFVRKALELRRRPITWNKIRYCDNMDLLNGMPSIRADTFEISLTDPPYNADFKGNKGEVDFNDNLKNYKKWCKNWFTELKRISKGIIIFPGNINVPMWCNIEKPNDIIDHYKPNCQGYTSRAWKCKKEHILFYGEFNNRLPLDVIKANVKTGKDRELKNGIHTTPKPLKVIKYILKHLKPKTVIDPFMGSGTTAVACQKLGIKWFGYEKKAIYSYDINKRLKNLKKEPDQIKLLNFTNNIKKGGEKQNG